MSFHATFPQMQWKPVIATVLGMPMIMNGRNIVSDALDDMGVVYGDPLWI